jgi:hypothetical protein
MAATPTPNFSYLIAFVRYMVFLFVILNFIQLFRVEVSHSSYSLSCVILPPPSMIFSGSLPTAILTINGVLINIFLLDS